jgi:hypothetical protein
MVVPDDGRIGILDVPPYLEFKAFEEQKNLPNSRRSPKENISLNGNAVRTYLRIR